MVLGRKPVVVESGDDGEGSLSTGMKKMPSLKGGGKGIRNLGKVANRFRFDFLVEKVDKLCARGDVVVVLERGKEVLGTEPVNVTRKETSVELMQMLTKEVTLFQTGAEGEFKLKEFKVALRLGAKDGKTLGKSRVNLADYAEVPSGKNRLSCKLSNGAAVVITITSTFLNAGKKRGTSSGVSSSVSDSATDVDSELDQLDLDDDLDLEGSSVPLGAETGAGGGRDAVQLRRTLNQLEVQRKELERENLTLKKEMSTAGRRAGNGFGALRFGGGGAKINTAVASKESSDSGGGLNAELAQENLRLKAELKELEARMSREPQQTEMLDDLRKAKAALAEVSVQKETAETELRELHRRVRRRKKALIRMS